MSNGKILFTVIGIALAVLAIANLTTNPVKENWWGGTSFMVSNKPAIRKPDGQEVAFSGNFYDPNAMMGSNKFVSVPSFQAVLSPRFSNVQYGANIKYNMPDRENLATPCDPLTFGDYRKDNFKPCSQENYSYNQNTQKSNNYNSSFKPSLENYNKLQTNQFRKSQGLPTVENYSGSCANCGSGSCGGGCPVSCGKGGYGMGHAVDETGVPPGYVNGDYKNVYDSLPSVGINMGSSVPVGDVTSVNELGEAEQYLAINTLMPANTKAGSRLYAMGDKVRGDLPIVPCQSGWFSVYPNINRDLSEGALNVLAGAGGGGESYNKMLDLLLKAGPSTTLGGVDLAQELPAYNANMNVQQITNLKSSLGDIQVTAFP
jgi:hypothetical protein